MAVPDLALVKVTSSGDSGSCRACNLARAFARSSAWTSLFGGSSSRICQPCGGLGGGLMKNILLECGA